MNGKKDAENYAKSCLCKYFNIHSTDICRVEVVNQISKVEKKKKSFCMSKDPDREKQ